MRPPSWTAIILSGSVALSVTAAIKERGARREALAEAARLREEVSDLLIHKKALIHQMNPTEFQAPFLVADSGAGLPSEGFHRSEPTDLVLYLLSTGCARCSANYSLLNDLVEAGVPVVGLALDTLADLVVRHREEWDLRFPVLVRAEGSAVASVPRYAVPTTVVISGERVTFLEFGKLEGASSERLRQLFRAWSPQ